MARRSSSYSYSTSSAGSGRYYPSTSQYEDDDLPSITRLPQRPRLQSTYSDYSPSVTPGYSYTSPFSSTSTYATSPTSIYSSISSPAYHSPSSWDYPSRQASYSASTTFSSQEPPKAYAEWTLFQSTDNIRRGQYVCLMAECDGKAFERNGDLIRHYNSKHNIERQLFDCPILGCSREGDLGLPRTDKLLDHIREKHKAPYPKTAKGDPTKKDVLRWLYEYGYPLKPSVSSSLSP